MCVLCAHILVCAFVSVQVWKPEANTECLYFLFITLYFFKTQSLIEPRATLMQIVAQVKKQKGITESNFYDI